MPCVDSRDAVVERAEPFGEAREHPRGSACRDVAGTGDKQEDIHGEIFTGVTSEILSESIFGS